MGLRAAHGPALVSRPVLRPVTRDVARAFVSGDELAEAIPPAYTEWLGSQLLAAVRGELELAAPARQVALW